MKPSKLAGILAVVALCTTASTSAVPRQKCERVTGKFVEYVVEKDFIAPNDPLGRVVNYTQGTFKSIGTAILTNVTPFLQLNPVVHSAETRHLFVVNETDQVFATGVAVFTEIPGTPNVDDVLTLTITGGTGAYEGASGEIVATGVGFNFLAPPPPGAPGPVPHPVAGSTFFEFRLEGEICKAQ
jgi:hypothetical protein